MATFVAVAVAIFSSPFVGAYLRSFKRKKPCVNQKLGPGEPSFYETATPDNGFHYIEQALAENKLGQWDDYGKGDR